MLLAALCWLVPAAPVLAQVGTNAGDGGSPIGGPVRIRQPSNVVDPRDATPQAFDRESALDPAPRPVPLGEFELFVRRLANQSAGDEFGLRRFGWELMTGQRQPHVPDYAPRVPEDYVLSSGDEVLLLLWGSVDADLRLLVDRSGRISIPRVGPVVVAGTRVADLSTVISQRVGQVFKNFQLSATLGQLRPIRVYVTGFTPRPGAYTVSSLSTMVNAIMRAGGPTAAGSFRHIELRRAGKTISRLDLYDLLVRGDNAGDQVLQPDDIVHIGPVGTQVGLIGSVNKPGIFELLPGETVADVVRMAAGFSAVADRTRLSVESLDQRNDIRISTLELPAALTRQPQGGDVLRVFSGVEATLSVERQNKRVRIEGEVMRPGEYILPAASSVADALRAAGGLSTGAYLYATEFTRESVRQVQQTNYDRALRDLETDLTKSATTQRTSTAEDAAVQSSRVDAGSRLVARLRDIRPTGRIVLELPDDATALPDLALEDGDRLYIPPRPTTVGVFGSVFNGGSYLFQPSRTLQDYLQLAGGATRGADEKSVFVVRANGSVISVKSHGTGWFSSDLSAQPALPGDTIFVPEELNKTTVVQNLKDWTQILYQFGIGLAGIKSAVK